MHAPLSTPVRRQWTMSDGYSIRGRVWPSSRDNLEYALIYLHGIQSHGGWFEWSASLLAASGCAVILPDRRGSGLNEIDRGDTPSWRRWLKDIDEIAAWARSEFNVKRFDLAGVSWGGKPATAWCLRQPTSVRRLLLIAPGLFPAVDVGAWTRFQIGRALLAGGRRRFNIPLNDPALFTDNPAGRNFIEHDPLKLTDAAARFFWQSRLLDRHLLRTAPAALNCPTTLLLAESDQIIRNSLTAQWIRRVAGAACECVSLPDTEHTPEFAADIYRFEQALRRWLSGESQAIN